MGWTHIHYYSSYISYGCRQRKSVCRCEALCSRFTACLLSSDTGELALLYRTRRGSLLSQGIGLAISATYPALFKADA